MIDQSTLKEIIHYSSATGVFTWIHRHSMHFKSTRDAKAWNTRFSGKVAGSKRTQRDSGKTYINMVVFGCQYSAHRLAWFYIYGEWPKDEIDHINGDGTDNRLLNIREVNSTENNMNMRKSKRNKSGVTGVYYDGFNNKWVAEIRIYNKKMFLGRFSNINDAKKVRMDAEIKHGFHNNHGEIRPL